MLQLVYVLTTGGILLFSTTTCPDTEIFAIIIGKILENKLMDFTLNHKLWTFQYRYDHVLGLIFVAIWRKEIVLEYVDKFLDFLRSNFQASSNKIIWKGSTIIDAPNFSKEFQAAFEKWNRYAEHEDNNRRQMREFKKAPRKTQKPEEPIEKAVEETNNDASPDMTPEMSPDQSPRDSHDASPEHHSVDDEGDLSPRDRFLKRQQEQNQARKKKGKKQDAKKQTMRRTWDGDTSRNLSEKEINNLGLNKSKISTDSSPRRSSKYEEDEEKVLEQFVDSDKQVEQSTFFKKIVGNVQKVIGNKSLTKEDLGPVLASFKQKLMEKNVALEVADKITDSVGQSLIQTKTKSFTSVQATVRGAINEALVKILTPKRHIDLIAEVAKAKLQHRPYVVVFIGVNGVGKSTNLAKVAFMLKNSKFSVMLAACDNFRAGAVEQLQVHGKNLDIPVFDRGYKEEPPEIAYQAIKQATMRRIDVVLIDTAGRMQDNTPHMKALARLVEVNKPNLIVFIGQALVGNDAIDQITKFNRSLSDYSESEERREIDAILLSKFDTVDDKVGTAVSMCYSTSKPILYVGVGQKYPNLRKLNIATIVHFLMS